jgi:hydroxyacylglutathione hydrolase
VAACLDVARADRARITHILETHIHADFVSGSRELAVRTGAPIYVGAQGDYGFEHRPLMEDDVIELGQYRLRVLHTPGHTPEHVCYLVSGGVGAEAPWGLFSGDTLFAGEVGRPDLLGDGTEKQLVRQLYYSLHEKILPLGDEIVIYPAHGEGSPCGASIGDRQTSTIGYERHHNSLLQESSQATFVEQVLAALSPAPAYYSRMKQINAKGPHILGLWPHLQPLLPDEFQEKMAKSETVVVDTREIEAFGGAHIAGAINIGLRQSFPIWIGRILDETFPIWTGWMIDPEHRILLVLPEEDKVSQAQRHLLRVGYENIGGYLRQGMRGWIEAGLPFERIPQMSVHKLKQQIDEKDDLQVLDVRSNAEWQEGHIPTAEHIYVPNLRQELDRLDRDRPVATYCGSGYRSSIAASILQRNGFNQVRNIPGSMSAWKAAGYSLEKKM